MTEVSIILLFYITNILILVLIQKKNAKFPFKISNINQLIFRLMLVLAVLLFIYYVFLRRLSRITLVVDLNIVFETLNAIYNLIPWYNLIVLGWFVCLLIGFFMLLIMYLKSYWYKTLLSLFLYFYQKPWMLRICSLNVRLKVKFTFGFLNLIKKYVPKLRPLAFRLCPIFILNLEKFLFKFLLPYLIIFDAYCNFWVLTKIFIILPWYYLYAIIRGTYLLFNKFHSRENAAISDHFYR